MGYPPLKEEADASSGSLTSYELLERALCAHAARWERELDVRIDELDLGGGFGAPVFQGDPTFDLDAAGAALRELLEEYDRGGRRWFVELGRFLAAPAGAAAWCMPPSTTAWSWPPLDLVRTTRAT